MINMQVTRKTLENIFACTFSIAVFILFFALISMNDLVLGNDSAFHLKRAVSFLEDGIIPMGDFAWYPPLYHILLSSLIAFTGAASIEQMIFLMKALTALIDWLLIFAVYLIGTKFFGKKYGVLASALMLLCFPLFEFNFWGGYTGLLSLAFMSLLFLYISLMEKGIELVLVTFLSAFSMVSSHPLATFLAGIILPPFILITLLKLKGRYFKASIAAISGGAIAFLLYYLQPILIRLDTVIAHVFFEIRTMTYQIPFVSASAFLRNFGFILFFAVLGIFISFFKIKGKKIGPYLILILSLLVPFLLSQSYLLGLYLPYQWFLYYLMPPLVVFAAVTFSLIIDALLSTFSHIKNEKKNTEKAIGVIVVIFMCTLIVFRFQTVTARINESAYFYSTSDLSGYDAAIWIKKNFPDTVLNGVVTEKPGSWFGVYSGKSIIAETNPIVEWNTVAEAILDLSYEISHPSTLIRSYVAKGYISSEIYTSLSGVWRRVAYVDEEGVYISFNENGVRHRFALSKLSREINFDTESYPKRLVIKYFNDNVMVTESLSVKNDSYPSDVVWSISALRREIQNVTLYITHNFDLAFSFTKSYIPTVLNGENPWSKPSTTHGNDWAVVNFSPENVAEKYVGIYDEKNKVAFAVKFEDLPDWGNIGALASMQIDAIRFEYQLGSIGACQSASVRYKVLTFSETDIAEGTQLDNWHSMFMSRVVPAFTVSSRSYADYIREFGIKFLVYEKSKFDSKLLNCKLLQMIYSNDFYVICRIKNSL
ncbi:MAG: hypothetical protein QXU99_06655 [Candidatus Bathyarchaeia archaeon]